MSHELANVMKTTMMAGSVLSLLMAVFPLLWGEVRVKWLVTGMTSAMTFAGMGILIGLFDPDDEYAEPVKAVVRPVASEPFDWTPVVWTLEGLATLVVAAVACVTAMRVKRKWDTRRQSRLAARTEAKSATDPVKVAQRYAHDLMKPVAEAIARMDRLRGVAAQPANQEEADALALIDQRLPSVMKRYALAAEAASDDERRDLAAIALQSVIDIGEVAENARKAAMGRMRDELSTESRYVADRSGRTAGALRSVE